MTKRLSRLDRAIAVRDAALIVLRNLGQYEMIDGNRHLTWRNDDLDLLLRTPFQPKPPIEGEAVRLALVHGVPLPKELGYGLDVWHIPRGKVMNFEWDDQGAFHLAKFKPGDWQAEIFRLASLPLPLTA